MQGVCNEKIRCCWHCVDVYLDYGLLQEACGIYMTADALTLFFIKKLTNINV